MFDHSCFVLNEEIVAKRVRHEKTLDLAWTSLAFVDEDSSQGVAKPVRTDNNQTNEGCIRRLCSGCKSHELRLSRPSPPCSLTLLPGESKTNLPSLHDSSAIPSSSTAKPRLFDISTLFRRFRGKILSSTFQDTDLDRTTLDVFGWLGISLDEYMFLRLRYYATLLVQRRSGWSDTWVCC